MKKFLGVLVVAVFLFSSLSLYGVTETKTLWGKQIAGSGHARNAVLDGNTLVLSAPATITSVEGDTAYYCIWTVVTPQNRNARSVLCGGTGREDIVGKILPAGSYRVIPGLNGKSVVYVTIELQ